MKKISMKQKKKKKKKTTICIFTGHCSLSNAFSLVSEGNLWRVHKQPSLTDEKTGVPKGQ